MKNLKITFYLIVIFLVWFLIIDILGAVFWIVMNQTPVDNFYVGTITTHLTNAYLIPLFD